jgi:hypothetical protein
MKTKARRGGQERQIVLATRIGAGYPHPRHFGKRGCKLLIIKDGTFEKRGKSAKESAVV